jgi:hypothetical protein
MRYDSGVARIDLLTKWISLRLLVEFNCHNSRLQTSYTSP